MSFSKGESVFRQPKKRITGKDRTIGAGRTLVSSEQARAVVRTKVLLLNKVYEHAAPLPTRVRSSPSVANLAR